MQSTSAALYASALRSIIDAMRITVLAVGKIKEKYLVQGIAEYAKRLSRYCKLDIIEVPDEKTPDRASEAQEEQIKALEGARLGTDAEKLRRAEAEFACIEAALRRMEEEEA